MSIVMVLEVPGATSEQYDSVNKQLASTVRRTLPLV